MRSATLLAAAALLVLVPSAKAADACTQADPCPIFVDIREDGLYSDNETSQWNVTVGDWFVVNATNMDIADVNHTLTLQGQPWTLHVAGLDEAETAPFQLAVAGTYMLRDDAGHNATVLVLTGDAVDHDAGVTGGSSTSGTQGDGSSKAPAPALALAAAGIAAALLVRRR